MEYDRDRLDAAGVERSDGGASEVGSNGGARDRRTWLEMMSEQNGRGAATEPSLRAMPPPYDSQIGEPPAEDSPDQLALLPTGDEAGPEPKAPAAASEVPDEEFSRLSIDAAIDAMRREAVDTAARDAEAGLPRVDVTGISGSEEEIRERCSALFHRWHSHTRDALNATVSRIEGEVSNRIGRASLAVDRFERITHELLRLKARLEIRRDRVSDVLEVPASDSRGHRAFKTRWYGLAIGFLGLVEFLANAPVFASLLPRDPLTEQQLRIVAETSVGWLAGAERVVSHFILRPDAALLAAGVVTFLCVLAHFFGNSLRSMLLDGGRGRDRDTVTQRSHIEHLIPMVISGVGLALVLGVLFEARMTLGQVAETRFSQDSASIEELRRTASWLRVDGNLVAANEQANRADDLEAMATEQREYAASMSGLSFPILLLNTTLVLVAISASYFHTRDRRRERFNDTPFDQARRELIGAGEESAQLIVKLSSESARYLRDLRTLLAERPLREGPALVHQMEAVIALYRAENGRLRGLDPQALPAFSGPVRLGLEVPEEAARTLLMRDPDEIESEQRALGKRFQAVRQRFTREAAVW